MTNYDDDGKHTHSRPARPMETMEGTVYPHSRPVIATEDIRPGDVVEFAQRFEVDRIEGQRVYSGAWSFVIDPSSPETAEFRLVHRPDPDAEVIDALILSASTDPYGEPDYDKTTPEKILSGLRARGFDIVKKAEPEPLGYHGRFSQVLDRSKGIATCMNGDPHPGHEWYYTDEGGGHMIENPGPDDKKWTCPGRKTRAES